jgi:hypothetical protein
VTETNVFQLSQPGTFSDPLARKRCRHALKPSASWSRSALPTLRASRPIKC